MAARRARAGRIRSARVDFLGGGVGQGEEALHERRQLPHRPPDRRGRVGHEPPGRGWGLLARGHRLHDRRDTVGGFVVGLEDERPLPIPALDPTRLSARGEEEATGVPVSRAAPRSRRANRSAAGRASRDRGVKAIQELSLDGPLERWRARRDPQPGLRRAPQAQETVDGLPGGDGAFLACSLWLVDSLALLGRLAEARALFERLLSPRNDVGLLSEQYDPRAGRLIGNFPQAISRVALANSAYLLSTTGASSSRGADRRRD